MGDEERPAPKAIEPDWLTGQLEAAGVARGARVVDVAFDGYIGTGQTGSNARLKLTWDEPQDHHPASLVGKFPSTDPNARAAAFGNGVYLKEWTFYDRVAKTVGVRAPRCLASDFDHEEEHFVLVLEDLADSVQGDQLDGLSDDQVALAIEQAVALHAPRFGDPAIETLFTDGQPAPTREDAAAGAELVYGMTLPGFLDRLGDRLDPDVARLATDFAPLVGRWTMGTGTPSTIVHYDFRADNFLFGQTPDAPPIVVVDWQTVNPGIGGSDVAYAVSGSYPDPARRAAVERDFVEEYRRRMAAAGVGQSADDCWRDYRFGSLWGMIITVIATMLAASTERGNDMLTAMAQRHGRQALDLDALSLLA